MATTTSYEYIPSCYEASDGNWPWNSIAALPSGEASWSQPGDAAHINESLNRIIFTGIENMFSSHNLTPAHRLRDVDFKFEARQGLAVFAEYDPYKIRLYWSYATQYIQPPLDFAWPGTVFTSGHTLEQWGFSLAGDGTAAMTKLLSGDFRPRIQPYNFDGSGVLATPAYVRQFQLRITYDLPVPRNAGLLTGIL